MTRSKLIAVVASVTTAVAVLLIPSASAEGATVNPISASQYATQFTQFPPNQWLAADGAISIKWGAKNLWLFADTTRTNPNVLEHNSFIVQDPATGTWTVKNVPMPNASDGSFFWPGSAAQTATGGVQVVALRTKAVFGSGFTGAGTSVFTFDANLNLVSRADVTTQTNITWGVAMYKSSDGYFYVYGIDQGSLGEHNVYVERVPHAKLADASAWQLWSSGSVWTAGLGGTPKVVATKMGASFSIDSVNGVYTIVTKPGDSFANDVVEFTSSNKLGPFAKKKVLATLPAAANGNVTYGAAMHLDVPALASGKKLLTVCRNEDFNQLWTNPDGYRPLFFEVTL